MNYRRVAKKDDGDMYAEKFIKSLIQNNDKRLEFVEVAYKILGHCSMGLVFDFTDDVHLDNLTSALVKYPQFAKQVNEISDVKEYIQLAIPKDETLQYYVSDGIEREKSLIKSSRE